MSKFYNFSLFVLLVIAFMPTTVFAQAATIVSEREPIVVYSENDLNPKQPGYEWTGSTLLKDIRVIDGMGNEPQTGRDVLIADGKIQAVGKTGSLDIPKDARIIDGAGYIGDNPLIIDVQPPHYIEAHNNGGLEGTMSRYATITQAIMGDIMTPENGNLGK